MRQDRPDHPHYPTSLKQRLAEQWVRRQLRNIAHERRVAAIASTIFDLTRAKHKLTLSEKRLLLLGAVLHDVGRKISVRRHPAVGARLIRKSTSLSLSPAERRCVGYLTRYHRGAVPEPGYDDILAVSDGRKRLLIVLAILRAADALDGRQHESPRLVFVLRRRRLSITVYLADASAKCRRFYKRRKKFRLLQDLLDIKIELNVRQVEAISAVD
jgi:exopolyphosphatase/pppGpp-phosphohydrolase